MKLLTTPPRGARLVRDYQEPITVAQVESDAELAAALGHVPLVVANGRYALYVDDRIRYRCTPLGTAVALHAELTDPPIDALPDDSDDGDYIGARIAERDDAPPAPEYVG